MTSIAFRVDGLPPKKDSGDSIWGKKSNQIAQLITLRKKGARGNGRPFSIEQKCLS